MPSELGSAYDLLSTAHCSAAEQSNRLLVITKALTDSMDGGDASGPIRWGVLSLLEQAERELQELADNLDTISSMVGRVAMIQEAADKNVPEVYARVKEELVRQGVEPDEAKLTAGSAVLMACLRRDG